MQFLCNKFTRHHTSNRSRFLVQAGAHKVLSLGRAMCMVPRGMVPRLMVAFRLLSDYVIVFPSSESAHGICSIRQQVLHTDEFTAA